VVSDDVLKQFPKTRVMLGGRDPLLDQGREFAEHLRHVGGDVAMVIYSGFGHGFLSFDNPG
jgi:acetyl esterase/lipase